MAEYDEAAFLQVFDDIVRKHNLSSPGDIAIGRSLAAVMVSDEPNPVVQARLIASLVDLLPSAQVVGAPTRLEIELVEVSKPEQVESLTETNLRLQEENQRLRQENRVLKGSRIAPSADQPVDPMLHPQAALPAPAVPRVDHFAGKPDCGCPICRPHATGANVVPIGETTDERYKRIRQHKAEVEKQYNPTLRPLSNNYPTDPMQSDDPIGRGASRFDNRL